GGDGGGQRDTDGGTELVEGVDDARYQPGLVLTGAAEGSGGRGDEQRAASQREHHDAGKGFDVDVAVCRQADEQSVADGDQGQADDGDGTGADGADQAAGHDRSDHEGQGCGQEEQAGLQRAEAAKVLQVLRTEKEVRDEHAGRDEHQECAGRDRTARQQAQVHQGSPYGAFDDRERSVQDDGGRDGQERAEIRPARVTGVDHAVDERAGGGGDGHRAEHVEAPGGAVRVAARWYHGRDGGQQDDADRDVDEEDPAPAGAGGEDSADEPPGGE